MDIIKKNFKELFVILEKIDDDFYNLIGKTAELIIKSLKENNKILIAGNGGSAADAQHFVAELMGRLKKERKAIPAISLTTDTSFLTAWGNDYSFDTVFSRQIEGLGQKGDVFFGISTSGNSKNIIEAVKIAKRKGLKVILLLGKNGGKLKNKADIELIVPAGETPRIQEVQIMIIHILCELIEEKLI